MKATKYKLLFTTDVPLLERPERGLHAGQVPLDVQLPGVDAGRAALVRPTGLLLLQRGVARVLDVLNVLRKVLEYTSIE